MIPNIKINKNKKNRYDKKTVFNKNCLRCFFFKNFFDILENSINDNEKIIKDINRYTILLINITINNKINNNPVFILFYISDFN